jgi:small subunit ribosomal protein S2
MAIITIKELVEAGVHYGTKTSLWHPRMKPYIFAKRSGVYIIDLKETAKALINAHYFMQDLGKRNKSVLFVGTKRQAKDIIRTTAQSLGQPYVSERWLGGTMTNLETIRSSIRRLDGIEEEMANPDYSRQSKKAQARCARERRRILRNLEGVRNMARLPDALVVVDPMKELTSVREAHRLGIPVVGVVDTDCDPDTVNLPIPGNDDGIRAIGTIIKVLADGYRAGRSAQIHEVKREIEAAPAAAVEAGEAAAK